MAAEDAARRFYRKSSGQSREKRRASCPVETGQLVFCVTIVRADEF
jgi:hypothetical protein